MLRNALSLKSVEFSGENNDEFQSVYVDTSGDAYDAPHWEDNSDPLDGDAEDWNEDSDRQYPVCYVRYTKPKATVKVLIAPHDWFSQGARIKGDGPGDVDFQSANASLAQANGKWYATAAITASHVLDNTVYHYDPRGIPGIPSPWPGASPATTAVVGTRCRRAKTRCS